MHLGSWLGSPPCPKTTGNREVRTKVFRALVLAINGDSNIGTTVISLVRRTAFSEVVVIVPRWNAGNPRWPMVE